MTKIEDLKHKKTVDKAIDALQDFFTPYITDISTAYITQCLHRLNNLDRHVYWGYHVSDPGCEIPLIEYVLAREIFRNFPRNITKLLAAIKYGNGNQFYVEAALKEHLEDLLACCEYEEKKKNGTLVTHSLDEIKEELGI